VLFCVVLSASLAGLDSMNVLTNALILIKYGISHITSHNITSPLHVHGSYWRRIGIRIRDKNSIFTFHVHRVGIGAIQILVLAQKRSRKRHRKRHRAGVDGCIAPVHGQRRGHVHGCVPKAIGIFCYRGGIQTREGTGFLRRKNKIVHRDLHHALLIGGFCSSSSSSSSSCIGNR